MGRQTTDIAQYVCYGIAHGEDGEDGDVPSTEREAGHSYNSGAASESSRKVVRDVQSMRTDLTVEPRVTRRRRIDVDWS